MPASAGTAPAETPTLAFAATAARVAEAVGSTPLPTLTLTPVDFDCLLTPTVPCSPPTRPSSDLNGHTYSGASFTITAANVASGLTVNDTTNETGFTLTL